MKTTILSLVLVSATALPALAQSDRAAWMVESNATKPLTATNKASAGNASVPKATTTNISLTIESEPYNGVRTVPVYDNKTLIKLTTKLRFQTLVILPEDEEIIDVFGGDQEFWPTSSSQNLLLLKPAKANAETNLNVTTVKGTVYSFLVKENSKETPDMRVTIQAEPKVAEAKRKFINIEQYELLQSQLSDTKARVTEIQTEADSKVAQAKQHFPSEMRFTYKPWDYKKPFYVKAIWHDDNFTYIAMAARSLPTIYEVVDGKPSMVNFQVENGVYVVPKVLDSAYLALGEKRFEFGQQ